MRGIFHSTDKMLLIEKGCRPNGPSTKIVKEGIPIPKRKILNPKHGIPNNAQNTKYK
jgi:hypothetical protein